MNSTVPKPSNTLRGWRARVWAWVFFVALLKGLIPHAALAAVVMGGDPAAVLCAPALGNGAVNAGAEAAASQMASHGHCLCASMGDGAPPQVPLAPGFLTAQPARVLRSVAVAAVCCDTRLPPARGPPG
jgi:hypothetical protein